MNIIGMIGSASGALLAISILGVISGVSRAAFEDEWPWWATASAVGIVIAAAGLGLVS